MRDVHRVVAGIADRARVLLVGGDGAAVGLGGVVVAPDALIDVRRHVHEVAGARHHAADAIGRRQRLLRMRRGLDGVDVVVVGARMLRAAREHLLERRRDLLGARRRLAVGLPQAPRAQIHHRLGEQHLHVVVGGELLGDLAHGVGVGLVERGLRARCRRRRAADRRSASDSAAMSACSTGDAVPSAARALAEQRERLLRAIGAGRLVVVGAEHERRAPEADRAGRIAARAPAANERPRLFVVEGVGQAQPLIEAALRVGHAASVTARW